MDSFSYKNGELYVEGISASSLVERYGSPIYVYSEETLLNHFSSIKEAFSKIDPLICFSVKSCPNISILKLLVDQGCGLDVVSGGEVYRALTAGSDVEKIVFAGVGKAKEEILYAIESGVLNFNVESESELHRINDIAGLARKRIRVAIRVNPDIADSDTHEKTATGGRRAKFGIPIHRVQGLFSQNNYTNIELIGVHIHLGSPIPSANTYLQAIDLIDKLVDDIETSGSSVEFINIGGGFPATYNTESSHQMTLKEISELVCTRLQPLKEKGKRFIIEPGRSISANSGILLTTVEYLKQGWDYDHKIAVLDAGMNVLIRPTLYDAKHIIWPTNFHLYSGHWSKLSLKEQEGLRIDLVGPICETGDYFALDRLLPQLHEGETLAVFSCGAYGMSMANQYNSRCRPPEVLVSGGTDRLIRSREIYDDLIAAELCGIEH